MGLFVHSKNSNNREHQHDNTMFNVKHLYSIPQFLRAYL